MGSPHRLNEGRDHLLVITLHSAQTGNWAAFVEQSRSRLGRGENPALLPAHYLHVVLPKIGGYGCTVENGGQTKGYGYLFPRGIQGGIEGDTPVYTLRYHQLDGAPLANPDELTRELTSKMTTLLGGHSRVILYDPSAPHSYNPSHQAYGEVDIGRPDATEAKQVPIIQQVVWGSTPDDLYPVDIHSAEFGAPVSLVARVDGEIAGFLFGLTKFGGAGLPPLWQQRLNHRVRLESQLMAVLPGFRGRQIGLLLKTTQATAALAQGIHIINWTADPLQFANAVLNYSQLGAVVYEANPALYNFQNDLNRVEASRFSLTWLPSTQRVQTRFAGHSTGQSPAPLDMAQQPQIVRVNDGPVVSRFDVDAAVIAFEVPANWSGLQQADLPLAQHWRETTDQLFVRYLGKEPGHYMITGTGKDGPRCYLLGQRVDESLLDALSQTIHTGVG